MPLPGGLYRGRVPGGFIPSPPSLKMQLLPTQVTSSFISMANFCPVCAMPFCLRFRLLPCYHVVCERCSADHYKTQRCFLCQTKIISQEVLHLKDSLYVCDAEGCGMGFLNDASMQYHQYIQHSTRPTHDGMPMEIPLIPVVKENALPLLSSIHILPPPPDDNSSTFQHSFQNSPPSLVSMPALSHTSLPSQEVAPSLPLLEENSPFTEVKATFVATQDEDSDLEDLF
ncbi:hypothetical protein IE077_002007 [Cardiosporidium cionae]|uniref:RING-type E3 ubiquitin transferase n=1 Tax=Cardiosporidium cionae TaxID=476202 RepID=A0ABQ7JBT7_9APIC|nr:hypothetical protein IE077_002007 [Cardiosporidium cionae]|eukprot:KAF8821454.1 hypothetical protein IE077_002007 [Cardiosporidium cionae]